MPTAAEIAIDAFPAVTAGMQVTDETLKAANTLLSAYTAPGMILNRVQEERLAKAKAIIAAVQKHDTTTTQNTLGSLSLLIVLCVASFALFGCGTGNIITPRIHDSTASLDPTTPVGFKKLNSGFLGYHDSRLYLNLTGTAEISGAPIQGDVFGVLAADGPDIYNRAMKRYAPQLAYYFNAPTPIPENAGISPFTDEYGNKLFRIDDKHLTYFMDAGNVATNPDIYPIPTK